ncbi:hypothetical protein MJA45_18835 [Paenibacillus aurantius]|uniref:Uncharacterized protein n=1 Tax=Paenibacillus aurantius TaxID=2918900 RepID=A0AA96RDQ5_9BACL|nr:hypothetical protein [Paenibacillus aurantius]WNQ09671.1 hypothetical protein MJA45_18835 [Paenibacillus aurantius]
MSDELLNKVIETVNKSGMPVEMYCSKIFTKNGWEVNHLTHYKEDDASSPLREIDLVCTPPGHKNIRVVVSCKQSKDNHWILHSIQNPMSRYPYFDEKKSQVSAFMEIPFIIEPTEVHSYFIRESHREIWSYLHEDLEVLKEDEKDLLEEHDVNFEQFREYWAPERISIFQSVLNRKESDDAQIRNAGLSALSAIKSLSGFNKEDDRIFFDDPSSEELTYWIPLIVFGGKLFEVYYGDDYENIDLNERGQVTTDNLKIQEINRARCTFTTDLSLTPFEGYSTLGIDVVTLNSLEEIMNLIINAVNLIETSEIAANVISDWATYLKFKGYSI